MRIVHVVEAWNGGIATYINTLIREQARNHQIHLVYSPSQATYGFDTQTYLKQGVSLHPYTSSRNPLKILHSARQVRKICDELKPDIIHLHSTFAGVYGRVHKPRAPVVYCAHGWSFVQEKGTIKKNIYAVIEKILSRRCDGIINISNHEMNAAQSRGVIATLNDTILSGAEPSKAGRYIPALDLDPMAINLAFIGRLDHKKGYDIAIKAMQRIARKDIHLYVMGTASRDQPVPIQNMPSNVHLCGWVDHEQIDDYIKLFDAVLVPSRHEAFGLVVIEAMRNARAPIVSRAGALPELVDHGNNGFVFDLDDNASDLANILDNLDKGRLRLMGAQSYSRYQKLYSAERMADDIEAFYNKVLYTRQTSS